MATPACDRQACAGTASARTGGEWFEGFAADEQFEVLRDLSGFCIQARATVKDGPEGVRADIRPTRTSAALITPGQLPAQLIKIINLPRNERVKKFRLLVALLGVTDKRRRERSYAVGCTHAWHLPVRNQHRWIRAEPQGIEP
ncbi:DUF5958 family protein [Streptomyces sp. enrichment culture]|uniref:DUF5958 family protein n=1 Tax=Streptomyces sp. enrichment culture TaxID=1795815 RepID=UPI003F56E98C